MPIVAADIKYWSSINNPENDTAAAGGAIQDDAHATGGIRVEFTDIAATDTFQVLSDGADTRTITVHYRLATGVITSEALVLNGVTPVTSSGSAERLMKAVLSAKDAARTVTVRRTSGATTIFTLGPNVISSLRTMYDAASAGSQRKRYFLFYAKNTHATLTLLNATVTLTADPQARIKIGLHTAKGDVPAVANRLAAPSGITFSDDNVGLSVPGTTLAAGERIGIWAEQDLPANDPAFKSTYSVQVSGQST